MACYPGTTVGQFVPFYFCPRSVMLYSLHKGNNPDLTYQGGQRHILHLEADFREVVTWAEGRDRPWAFTDGNAGSYHFQSFRDPAELGRLRWDYIADDDFSRREVKEAKQAEFLIYGSFPWTLVRKIGVMSDKVAKRVGEIVSTEDHRPEIAVQTSWYF